MSVQQHSRSHSLLIARFPAASYSARQTESALTAQATQLEGTPYQVTGAERHSLKGQCVIMVSLRMEDTAPKQVEHSTVKHGPAALK